MSVTVLSPEQARESRELSFQLLEPGFLVEVTYPEISIKSYFVIVSEKDEKAGILRGITLNQQNILKLLSSEVPTEEIFKKEQLLNVHPTAITDAMCREREGLRSYCIRCKKRVYEYPRLGKNYSVGEDTFCRHIDCEDLSTLLPVE